MNLMTIMYISIQQTLDDTEDMEAVHSKLCKHPALWVDGCVLTD